MSSRKNNRISVIRRGEELDEGTEDEVDYEFPSFNHVFGSHINTIPMHTSVAAPRNFYGARFVNQAMPMVGRETPLVSNATDDGRSFDELYGEHVGAIRAKAPGTITEVGDKHLLLTHDDGTVTKVRRYNNMPFNRKTGMTQTFTVKQGDKVPLGGLLAKSNFTDDNGGLALGLNARIAVVPYMGWTMDDAAAISRKFADRAKSEHLYEFTHDTDEHTNVNRDHYVSVFPSRFKKEQIERIDEKGVIRPGSIVRPGDPLILATRPKTFNGAEHLGKLSKSMRDARKDSAQVWDKGQDGEVTDVAWTKDGPVVYVKTQQGIGEGDKICLRPGQKGVVSKIIPDHEMPRDENGEPFDMLLNPLGLYSRVNANTPFEILLGKIAAKTGVPYKLPNVTPEGTTWLQLVKDELAKHKVSPTERVFDPVLNRFLQKPVLTGSAYILKLHHTGDSKLSSRSQGSYTQDEQPTKGGGESAQAKRMSGLENYGLLSAGASNVIKENTLIRGQKNDAFWQQIRAGQKPAMPGSPFVWDKYKALLNGAGFHARDKGKGVLRIGPMTDKELDERNPMEITEVEAINPHNMEAIPGGTFDPSLVATNGWGKISLPFALPNPAFEDVVRKMLGLTKEELRAVLAGRRELP